MVAEHSEWLVSQQKRIGYESVITGTIVGLTFLAGYSNVQLLFVGTVLFLLLLMRYRAVNIGDEQHAIRVLTCTTPILVLGSLGVVYYTILRTVIIHSPTITVLGDMAVFAVVGVVLAIAILLVEYTASLEYFEWWKDRALEKADNDETGLWLNISKGINQLSPVAVSKPESEKKTRKLRAKKRVREGIYRPPPSVRNRRGWKWSWLKPIVKEAFTWRRLLPISVGGLFFSTQGFSLLLSLACSLFVWFASSLLADHIKYLFYFRPLRDGHYTSPSAKSFVGRILNETESYWSANLLVFVLLWLIY
jgi:hypothetical protein